MIKQHNPWQVVHDLAMVREKPSLAARALARKAGSSTVEKERGWSLGAAGAGSSMQERLSSSGKLHDVSRTCNRTRTHFVLECRRGAGKSSNQSLPGFALRQLVAVP